MSGHGHGLDHVYDHDHLSLPGWMSVIALERDHQTRVVADVFNNKEKSHGRGRPSFRLLCSPLGLLARLAGRAPDAVLLQLVVQRAGLDAQQARCLVFTPPVLSKVRWMSWRSRSSSTSGRVMSPDGTAREVSLAPSRRKAGRAATPMLSPLAKTSDCSTAFSSSRTLPGQL